MNGRENLGARVPRCPHPDGTGLMDCPCYGKGWSLGKDKAHSEVRGWVPAFHAADCECEVCRTVAALVETIVDYLPPDTVLDFSIAGRDGVKSRLAAMLAGRLMGRQEMVGCGGGCCGTGDAMRCPCPCHPDTKGWRPVRTFVDRAENDMDFPPNWENGPAPLGSDY